ncbi:MAG: GH39 family glycosyl hydrolase [Lactovum sp.]
MDFLQPWENIEIKQLKNIDKIQYFDSKIRIIFTLMGQTRVALRDKEILLENNDFLILTKSDIYEIKEIKGKVFKFSLDYFVTNSMDKKDYIFIGNSTENANTTNLDLAYSLRQLLLMKVETDNVAFTKIYQEYFSLLLLLEKYYCKEVTVAQKMENRHKMDEIRFYIDNYFDKEITLTALSQKLFMSEQYLSRLFKEHHGLGILEYIIKKRLEKVRRLLLETEKPIIDIAFSSGFSNINSFNRIFKKYQGLTPTQYRKEVKQDSILQEKVEIQELELEDVEDIKEYIEKEQLIKKYDEKIISSQKSSVDLKEKSNYLSYDKLMINLGYAEDLLHRSFIKRIRQTKDYTNFKYGRVWGIISNAILPEVNGQYDYTKFDEIIQAILDLDMLPFLELGIKGKTVHTTNMELIKQEVLQFPNKKMEGLLERYQKLLEHCIEKYGYEEVSHWILDLYKPDEIVLTHLKHRELALFSFHGKEIDLATDEGYLAYFSLVKETVTQIHPKIKLGGSGLSIDLKELKIERFIKKWAEEKVKPDFLSLCVFPLDKVKENFSNHRPNIYISPDSEYLISSIQKLYALLHEVGLCKDLYITEFNVTISSRDIVNDTAFKGPYILKNILPILEKVDLIGYWQLSDFSSIAVDVNNSEIFGGSGLITKNGIPKPAFYSFDFLNALGLEFLYVDEGIVVTRNSSQIIILLYQYSHLSSQYYWVNQSFNRTNVTEMFENTGVSKFNLVLTDLETDRKYSIKTRRMGVNSGAIIGEANTLSLKSNYKKEEVEYLKHRCIPTLKKEEIYSIDKKLSLAVDLNPHDMLLIEIN